MVNESKLAELYSEIANKMDEMIPCEWKRIVLYAEKIGVETNIGFYFYTNDDQVHWSAGMFEVFEIDEYENMMLLIQLTDLVKELWLEFKNADEEIWSVFTFDIDSEWKFKANFKYDLDEKISDFERRIIWSYDELNIILKGEYARKILKEYILANERELPEELK